MGVKALVVAEDPGTQQRTLNPRVRGSSPWRRTRSDLGFYPRFLLSGCRYGQRLAIGVGAAAGSTASATVGRLRLARRGGAGNEAASRDNERGDVLGGLASDLHHRAREADLSWPLADRGSPGDVQHGNPAQPAGHPLPAQRSPLPPRRPLGQFRLGDECDGGLPADQLSQQPRREQPLETAGRDVRVQDDPVHLLGQISPPRCVGVRQELFQFLIGLEDPVTGKIIGRADRLGVLRAEELIKGRLALGLRRDMMHVVMARRHLAPPPAMNPLSHRCGFPDRPQSSLKPFTQRLHCATTRDGGSRFEKMERAAHPGPASPAAHTTTEAALGFSPPTPGN